MVGHASVEGAQEGWPLPNVWLGVSVEDQKTADERISLLLQIPAALRFVSYEPALGPLTFRKWFDVVPARFPRIFPLAHTAGIARPELDWIISGGESGPNARPSHPDWFRSVRDQCQAAGVPFFFKQWGEWGPGASADRPIGSSVYDPRTGTTAYSENSALCLRDYLASTSYGLAAAATELDDGVGGSIRAAANVCDEDVNLNPSGGQLYSGRHILPDGQTMIRFGKKCAGRLLDGCEWNEFPEFRGNEAA